MAGTSSIDGLVSGLDTTSLINQLMQIESAPQTLLKTKQTNTSNLVTALQALNTKVASLGDAAKTAASAQSWQALKVSSSAASVTATATSSASPTQIEFTVDTTAQSQVSLVSSSPARRAVAHPPVSSPTQSCVVTRPVAPSLVLSCRRLLTRAVGRAVVSSLALSCRRPSCRAVARPVVSSLARRARAGAVTCAAEVDRCARGR